jgi:protein O-GlcNAc transferase
MVKVFSFCIFGSKPKYCMGLLKNIEVIKEHFPEWMIWVYIGDTIPVELDQRLAQEQCVQRIYTETIGMENKVFRFFPIDTPDVEVCIVRDTDSRIHARDRACIQEFVDSDMKFHIIRDHPNHFHKIMAGMFGMKQGCVSYKIQEAYVWWKKEYATDAFWDDTYFLVDVIYPDIKLESLVHDTHFQHEFPYCKKPFRIPVDEKVEFVGQAYDFDAEGNEYAIYK